MKYLFTYGAVIALAIVVALVGGRMMWREALGMNELERRVDALEHREAGDATVRRSP